MPRMVGALSDPYIPVKPREVRLRSNRRAFSPESGVESSPGGLALLRGVRDGLGGHVDRCRLGDQLPSGGFPAKGRQISPKADGLTGRPFYGRWAVARNSSSFP